MLDVAAIAAHTQRVLNEATLHLHPFPHLVVDNVWPEPFYDALLKGIPPAELFADRPLNKRRLVVPFDWSHQYGARVWNFLVQEVLDRVVAPVLVQKFKQPLGEWLLANWPLPADAPTEHVKFQSTDGRILLRHRGYVIPPHRDPKWGLITCLMYLAKPGDSEAWGTQLYSVEGDVEAPSVARLLDQSRAVPPREGRAVPPQQHADLPEFGRRARRAHPDGGRAARSRALHVSVSSRADSLEHPRADAHAA